MTNKIKDTLKNHKYLLLSFFLPLLILEGIAIAEKIQPFGSGSFLIVDALHQYLPFFADYQEKLKHMDSMFYSFHAGLGYNFLGLWAYYLASPLNLVIALVPKSMLTMVLSHLYVLKIALCCFTAAFYFRKRRGKDEISIIAFGMAYGLCSYMVGYSWNIMWMEVMMMLPLILYGVDKLIKEHDGRFYCITLFISLWCNFYMSYMTCLFLILWYLLYPYQRIFSEWIKICRIFSAIRGNGSSSAIAGILRNYADIFSKTGFSKAIVVWNIWKYLFKTFSWNNTTYDGSR